MSLIKCSECDKEISNNVTSCPNCGNNIEKEEKNILSTKINKDYLLSMSFWLGFFGSIFIILDIILFFVTIEEDPSILIIFILVTVVFFIGAKIIKRQAELTKLTLTNKKITGTIIFQLKTYTINIPLEKIDNIVLVKPNNKIELLIIITNNSKYVIPYILNGKEFLEKTLKQLGK